jgi:hypothetical protein
MGPMMMELLPTAFFVFCPLNQYAVHKRAATYDVIVPCGQQIRCSPPNVPRVQMMAKKKMFSIR